MHLAPRLALALALALTVPASSAQPRTDSQDAATADAADATARDARIVDEAGALDPASRARIEGAIEALASRSSSELGVALVRQVGEGALEDVARARFRAMGLGRSSGGRGLLLFVAVDDRRNRLVVGDALRGRVTDQDAARLLTTVFRPAARTAGVAEATARTAEALARHVASPARTVTVRPIPQDDRPSAGSLGCGGLVLGLFGVLGLGLACTLALGAVAGIFSGLRAVLRQLAETWADMRAARELRRDTGESVRRLREALASPEVARAGPAAIEARDALLAALRACDPLRRDARWQLEDKARELRALDTRAQHLTEACTRTDARLSSVRARLSSEASKYRALAAQAPRLAGDLAASDPFAALHRELDAAAASLEGPSRDVVRTLREAEALVTRAEAQHRALRDALAERDALRGRIGRAREALAVHTRALEHARDALEALRARAPGGDLDALATRLGAARRARDEAASWLTQPTPKPDDPTREERAALREALDALDVKHQELRAAADAVEALRRTLDARARRIREGIAALGPPGGHARLRGALSHASAPLRTTCEHAIERVRSAHASGASDAELDVLLSAALTAIASVEREAIEVHGASSYDASSAGDASYGASSDCGGASSDYASSDCASSDCASSDCASSDCASSDCGGASSDCGGASSDCASSDCGGSSSDW